MVLGVHTPETQAERDHKQLKTKLKDAELTYAIVTDDDLAIWNAWGNSMWPSTYLIDKQGQVRYWWLGELNWQDQKGEEIMRQRIQELLAEEE